MDTRLLIVDADHTLPARLEAVLRGVSVRMEFLASASQVGGHTELPDVVLASSRQRTADGAPFLDWVGKQWGPSVRRVRLLDADPTEDAGAGCGDAFLERKLSDPERVRRTLLPAGFTPSGGPARDESDEPPDLCDRYLDVVSHELRTPLTALTNFLSLWDRHSDEPLKRERLLLIDGIREQSRRLAHQIGKLLLLARLERDEPTLLPEDFPVAAALEEGLEFSRQRAEQQGTSFQVRRHDASLKARGDHDDFCRAVAEIAENAVKFTPPGGEVVVSARGTDDGRVLVEIQDTGIGIDPGDHAAIFEPFHQLEQPLTRTYGGAGLGLTLARRVLDRWLGGVEVDSRLHHGATFRLWLPAAEVLDQELAVTGSHEDGHGS